MEMEAEAEEEEEEEEFRNSNSRGLQSVTVTVTRQKSGGHMSNAVESGDHLTCCHEWSWELIEAS